MPSVIAIDVGTIRVGCAYADDGVKIPFPIAVWERAAGKAEKEVIRTLQERQATKLIVGLPLGPAGEKTAVCESIETFVRRLVRRHPIEVIYLDESFSSIDATERISGTKRTGGQFVDALAACVILERYLSSL